MPVLAASIYKARACLVLAALLWSLGSLFVRLMREPLGLGLNSPLLTPLQLAFFRGLFGGLFMLALVRREHVRLRPIMMGMVLAFAAMSALYLTALGLGAAANAIFLQNTAPVWVYVFAVLILKEPIERRGIQVVLLAMAGALVIVAGGWPRDLPSGEERDAILVLFMGVGSGVMYAVVVLYLRVLRDHSTAWLVALNLLGTAGTLALYVLFSTGSCGLCAWVFVPSATQLGVLVVFGGVQMALPYWLFARGLKSVSPQEAAIITLIEPLLNPVWAYLITPEIDTPTPSMLLGGGLILLALIWRYLPVQKSTNVIKPHEHTNS
jgi:drug/metabolite transporter (DMT)-like permease